MTTPTIPPARTRVAVIGGGENCEHDVSRASAASVALALDPTKFDVVSLTIDRDGTWRDHDLRAIGLRGAVRLLEGCDVAFPLVHGPRGEDGTLAALCELAGLPYVGSGTRPGALAMDKWATKLVAQALGLATASGLLVTAETAVELRWTHPVVVKPVCAGSSRGVSLVKSPEGLRPALDAALALDDRALVEEVVIGREIDLAVLRRRDGTLWTAPALEIVVDGLFDYEAKYGGQAEFRIPAALERHESEALTEAALAVYEVLGCAGVARFDFFLTPEGPVLNEVNTVPGMTQHSQVPRMFEASGISYPALLEDLIESAHR